MANWWVELRRDQGPGDMARELYEECYVEASWCVGTEEKHPLFSLYVHRLLVGRTFRTANVTGLGTVRPWGPAWAQRGPSLRSRRRL